MGIVKGLPLTAVCKDPPTVLNRASKKKNNFRIAICRAMRGKIAVVRAETTRHDVVSVRTIAPLSPFMGLNKKVDYSHEQST